MKHVITTKMLRLAQEIASPDCVRSRQNPDRHEDDEALTEEFVHSPAVTFYSPIVQLIIIEIDDYFESLHCIQRIRSVT